MKKAYDTPKAVLVDYSFEINVVATSATCSGSHYVFQTSSGCNQYKWTDYPATAQARTMSLHPCDWVVEGQAFPNP